MNIDEITSAISKACYPLFQELVSLDMTDAEKDAAVVRIADLVKARGFAAVRYAINERVNAGGEGYTGREAASSSEKRYGIFDGENIVHQKIGGLEAVTRLPDAAQRYGKYVHPEAHLSMDEVVAATEARVKAREAREAVEAEIEKQIGGSVTFFYNENVGVGFWHPVARKNILFSPLEVIQNGDNPDRIAALVKKRLEGHGKETHPEAA